MFNGVSSGMFGVGCQGCITPVIGVAGDLSLGDFSALVNPGAISLLKANAYQAAKFVLGPKTKEDTLFAVADAYAKFVIPQTNRALTVFEIEHDMNFKRIAMKVKNDAMSLGDEVKGGLGVLPIGKLLLVGGVAGAGYWYYKRKKKMGGTKRVGWFGKLLGKKTSRRRSKKKTSFRIPTPPAISKSTVMGV